MTAQQEGGSTPAGMVAWAGGDAAPEDWDGGPVLFRSGRIGEAESDSWFVGVGGHNAQPSEYDAVAYTPRTPAGEGSGVGGCEAWRVVGREPTDQNRKFGHWEIEGGYLIASGLTYDDATRIAHAVNSHAGLVDALKRVVSDCQLAVDALGNSPAQFDSVSKGFGIIADRARAALARSDASEGGGK